MDKPAVALIYDRDAAPFAGLAERIRALGYHAQSVPPTNWHPTESAPTIVVCHAPESLNALAAALRVPKRPPLLAAYCTANGGPPPVLLRQCEDFIGWPCPDDELRLRLDRLTAGVPATPDVLNENLREEFLALNMVGRSSAFLTMLATVKKISGCDAPVSIEGETGTGKEMAARAIHYLGARRDQPFIPVNCGALPDGLIESELFGHAKGAFTDARERQLGLVAQADGGTLFLDEIDALTPKAQVTLLRFLQDCTYRPVGGGRLERADVRVIAACNVPLEQRVTNGSFREDLLYRLNIMQLRLPPLRERHGDAVLLARHFMHQYRMRYSQPAKYLPATNLSRLERYPWPGNVRELENLVQREFLLADGDAVYLGSRPRAEQPSHERRSGLDRRAECNHARPFSEAKADTLARFERAYLESVLSQTKGNITQAARMAGKERRALGKLLKKYGIEPATYR
ncbi:MAG TPA: sigma-54 dependent transcriptional regulator [Gammaproteobacteria bacterium]|nr:sigma-54 dependent transcriptional regulator [Gammaproteobacteria bacterium]